MALVDLFYPDNKNRLDRLNNLVYQCNAYQGLVTDQKTEYDNLVKTTNEQIIKAFGDMKESEKVKIELPDGTLAIEIVGFIASLFAGGVAIKGMNIAWKSWMLSQGRIGEAALVKLIGYPTWFKFARFGGMIAITIALDAIITAITGAVQRDELRKGIHDCLAPRKNIFKAYKTNEILLEALKSIIALFEFLNPTEEEAKMVIDKAVAKAQKKIEAITDEYIEKFLAEKDTREGAWTKEDHILGSLTINSLQDIEAMEVAPVDYLDGSLVAAEGENAIYLIIGGKRCLIPNMNTYQALFAGTDSIHRVLKVFLDSMPEGEPLSESACLMKCDEEIYFYSGAKKHLIRSIGDFNKVGFKHNDILNVTRQQADNIESAGEFIVADW